ncbi:MAG: response regulator [Propionibacteriales bacterium]|nr:response regulator [Propionibacteriales bacterium]
MRLVLCDDHRLLLEALSTALSARGWTVEATAASPSEAVGAVELHDPDVLVIDLAFPSGSGLDAARMVTQQHPRTKVVILTGLDSPDLVREALEMGVAGYTRKDRSIHAISETLERVTRGEVAVDTALLRRMAVRSMTSPASPRSLLGSLTPRERHVLDLLVDGRNTTEIVTRLNISDSTARTHVQSILSKLGVHSRVQAVALLHHELASTTPPNGTGPPRGAGLFEAARGAHMRVNGTWNA